MGVSRFQQCKEQWCIFSNFPCSMYIHVNIQWTIQCSINHLMFNEQFNVQGIFINQQAIQCSMHIQCSTNHSTFNEGFKVSTLLGTSQLVLCIFSHFAGSIHIQCSMYIQYSIFNKPFKVQCLFNIQQTIQCSINHSMFNEWFNTLENNVAWGM